jgi:uncharacterized protein (TIGR04222 family)
MILSGLSPLDRLVAFLVAWAGLCACAVLLGVAARRRIKPLDAPSGLARLDLDTYDLAYLSGGLPLVRDAVWAKLFALGALQLSNGRIVPVLGRDLTPDAHPVETALAGSESSWASTTWVALHRCFANRLQAPGLASHRAKLLLAFFPPALAWFLAAAICVLAGFFLNGPPGLPPSSSAFFLVPAVCLAGCVVGPSIFLPTRMIVRKWGGPRERINAVRQANAHLRPSRQQGRPDLSANEIALSVALFGLLAWAYHPRWVGLIQALYPPAENTGG